MLVYTLLYIQLIVNGQLSVSLKVLEGNIIRQNIKAVQIPSYHSIYENVCKVELQKSIFY